MLNIITQSSHILILSLLQRKLNFAFANQTSQFIVEIVQKNSIQTFDIMVKINKLTIFQTLMSDLDYPYNSPEEGIIRRALMKEAWSTSTPEAKQVDRRQFLTSGKRIRTVINLDYYEKMISIYDMILAMLSKLEKIIGEREAERQYTEISLLRIIGLILVEQDFIDEDILPSHHIGPKTFQNLSNELHAEYPDLNLKEFAEKYTDMFEAWPEKSKYEIKKS